MFIGNIIVGCFAGSDIPGKLARFEASHSVAVVHMCAYSAVVVDPVENFLAYYEKCGVFTQPRPRADRRTSSNRHSTDHVSWCCGESRERPRQPGAIHHSITSSARSGIDFGIVRPSAFAGFSIHDGLDCYRLLHTQIARLRTIEDLVHIGRGALVIVGDPIPVTRQPPPQHSTGFRTLRASYFVVRRNTR